MESNKRKVLLLDKGTMDYSTLIKKDLWYQLLNKYDLSEVTLRDKRYDLIIHLYSDYS